MQSFIVVPAVNVQGPEGVVRKLKDRLRAICKRRRIRLQEFFEQFDVHHIKKVRQKNPSTELLRHQRLISLFKPDPLPYLLLLLPHGPLHISCYSLPFSKRQKRTISGDELSRARAHKGVVGIFQHLPL